MIQIKVNGQVHQLDIPGDVPLLWVIREELELTGTKFGCGKGLCGSCTVLLGGAPVRSCVLPVAGAEGQDILTVESLSDPNSGGFHAVQRAWLELDVVQCGYCQPGQIMAAVGLIQSNPNPTDAEISAAMNGNLCRCGTYPRIHKAIRRAYELIGGGRP